MTELDDKLVPKAEELIRRFGKVVTVSGAGTKTYDPTTRKATLSDNFSYTLKATPPDKYSIRYVDGDTVKAGDFYSLVTPADIIYALELYQTMTLDSTNYKIVKIEPIYSGEQIATYQLHLRR